MLHDGVTVRMLREQKRMREAVRVCPQKVKRPKQRMTVKLARELCAGILRSELEHSQEHSQVRNARQVAALLRRCVKRAEEVEIPAELVQRFLRRLAKAMGAVQRLTLAEARWMRKRAKHQA